MAEGGESRRAGRRGHGRWGRRRPFARLSVDDGGTVDEDIAHQPAREGTTAKEKERQDALHGGTCSGNPNAGEFGNDRKRPFHFNRVSLKTNQKKPAKCLETWKARRYKKHKARRRHADDGTLFEDWQIGTKRKNSCSLVRDYFE